MTIKKPKFWSSEKLLALSAILISVCTLIVFFYQTNLIKQQQYMSVYPYLYIGNHGTGTKNYTYVMSNKGIGPAVIKSIKITTPDGEEFDDIQPYVASQVSRSDTLKYLHTNLSPGRLISPNEIIKIVESNDDGLSTMRALHEALNREGLKIEIEYESIYKERWLLSNDSEFPVRR